MTEQPSWAGDVLSYTAERGPLPLPQWDEVSQNTLDDLRLRLRESITESILMAVRGFFIPGPLGEAFKQLADWGEEVLNAQNLLDAINGVYVGENLVLLAIEAVFTPIRGLVTAIVEPLSAWLTWMWNLFSNITPNPAPTGPGANILVPLFEFLDWLWDQFGNAVETLLKPIFLFLKSANLQSLDGGIINEIWSRLSDGAEGIGKTLADVLTGIGDFVEGLVPAVTGIPGALNVGSIATWAQGLITKALTWPDFKTIYGEIPEKVLGVIPIANINLVNPELMSQGGFDTSTTLAAGTGWAWDGTTTRVPGTSGSAKVTGNGTALALYSNQSISVAPGDLLHISCWVKSTGTVGAGAITLSVVEFSETGVAATQSAGSAIASRAGSVTFVQIGSTPTVGTAYTVPAGVTSIRVKVAVTAGAATGSTVWFDDISVKKTGLLSGNWMNGVFGTVAEDIGSSLNELYDGFDNTTTPTGTQRTPAQVRNRGAAVRSSAVAGENKSATISTKLYNSQIPADFILTSAIPNGVDATKLTGTLDEERIPVLAATKVPELNEKADGAIAHVVINAAQIAALEATQASNENSGRSGTDGFEYITTTGLTPSSGTSSWNLSTVGTGTGTVRSTGTALAWVPGTTATATVRARFIKSTTVTSYQRVTVVIDGPIFNALSSGASPTPMVALVCRLNNAWTSYVYARIVPTGSGNVQLTLWKVSGGSEAQITVAGAGIYSWKLKIGDSVQVLAGDITALTFRLYVNSKEVASINDSSAIGGFVSVENAATNNFTGLMLRNGGVYSPASIGAFSMSDSAPPTTVGSGFKVNRTATSLGALSTGENIFPLGWFGNIVLRTNDITYDVSGTNTGKVTVSVEGWYQCTISCAAGLASANGGVVYSILWKGTGSGARSVFAYGGQSRFNAAGGTAPTVNGSFTVYLKAGDYVEPGYYSNVAISNTLGNADSNFTAKTTWFSVALINRSYN